MDNIVIVNDGGSPGVRENGGYDTLSESVSNRFLDEKHPTSGRTLATASIVNSVNAATRLAQQGQADVVIFVSYNMHFVAQAFQFQFPAIQVVVLTSALPQTNDGGHTVAVVHKEWLTEGGFFSQLASGRR